MVTINFPPGRPSDSRCNFLHPFLKMEHNSPKKYCLNSTAHSAACQGKKMLDPHDHGWVNRSLNPDLAAQTAAEFCTCLLEHKSNKYFPGPVKERGSIHLEKYCKTYLYQILSELRQKNVCTVSTVQSTPTRESHCLVSGSPN